MSNPYRDICNPNAWRDCLIPPTPTSDPSRFHSPSWQPQNHPVDGMEVHLRRARGLLAFTRFVFSEWDQTTYKRHDDVPKIEMYRDDVSGLIEVLGAVNESIDLAHQAAEAAMKESRQHEKSGNGIIGEVAK
ncbi:MAG: hypothetical protein HQL92_05825 [Magnetococcales bacterium]|nr:hypothetical protein [Magnetococcales bacterium]